MEKELGLHNKCINCMKADWIHSCCEVITAPKAIWERGKCWARTEDPDWELKIEMAQTQYQQARCPGIEEDVIGWLMGTKPPSIRDREPILHLPAPPSGKSSSRSKRKRKKPLSYSINFKFE